MRWVRKCIGTVTPLNLKTWYSELDLGAEFRYSSSRNFLKLKVWPVIAGFIVATIVMMICEYINSFIFTYLGHRYLIYAHSKKATLTTSA